MTPATSDYLSLVVGLPLLLCSAELLVRNSVRLAALIGKSRLFVGLTIAAFGTSAPELAIGVMGIVRGQADLGLGNIIGSNIFNTFFILGLGALIRPIIVSHKVIRRDIPILIGFGLMFFVMSLDMSISVFEAILLAITLIGYLVYLSHLPADEKEIVLPVVPKDDSPADTALSLKSLGLRIVLIVVSIGVMVYASHLMVAGAVGIASRLGISELVIGLTVLAVGTSLPEIAATLVAIRRNEHDLAVGNIMGSSIFNIVAVPATMTLVNAAPLPLSADAVRFDMPIMLLAIIACLPIFFSGHRISRSEGLLFLVYYAAYVLMLYVRSASDSPITTATLAWLIAPVLAVTLSIVIYRAFVYRRHLKKMEGRL